MNLLPDIRLNNSEQTKIADASKGNWRLLIVTGLVDASVTQVREFYLC